MDKVDPSSHRERRTGMKHVLFNLDLIHKHSRISARQNFFLFIQVIRHVSLYKRSNQQVHLYAQTLKGRFELTIYSLWVCRRWLHINTFSSRFRIYKRILCTLVQVRSIMNQFVAIFHIHACICIFSMDLSHCKWDPWCATRHYWKQLRDLKRKRYWHTIKYYSDYPEQTKMWANVKKVTITTTL